MKKLTTRLKGTVYFIYLENELAYIGCTTMNLKERLKCNAVHNALKRCGDITVTTLDFPNFRQGHIFEQKAIAALSPPLNIKDNDNYNSQTLVMFLLKYVISLNIILFLAKRIQPVEIGFHRELVKYIGKEKLPKEKQIDF